MSTGKTIAKNSLFLYSRMFLNMLVGLFTAGITLNVLGITDYGIYNVVGGFVSMFGFLNASMSQATQRFLSFDLGKGDHEQLKKTFSTTVTIHFGIAFLIVIALETFGLWYINHQLNVPADRLPAINIIYQFSVFSAFFGIIQVPYNALITAHERFNVYAYISFLEIAFKLLILFLLVHVKYDKLILYSFLLFCSSFIIRIIYRIYCRRNFKESRFTFHFDKAYFKTVLTFSGWNLFTNVAFVSKNQGINLLLNYFFGATLNAAYGITMQIQGIILNFVSNFQGAVNPQIVKSYASGNSERSIKLVQQSAKLSFGLILIMVCPIYMSLKELLNIWLKNYPEKTIVFIQLVLLNILIESISNPIMTLVQATGKIKRYQLTIGFLLFLNLPLSFLFLQYGSSPETVFIISNSISILTLFFRIIIMKNLIHIKLKDFFQSIFLRIIVMSLVIIIFHYLLSLIMPLLYENKYIHIVIISILSVAFTSFMAYFILLNQSEKVNTLQLIFRKNKND